MVDTSTEDGLLDRIVKIEIREVIGVTHVRANAQRGDLYQRVKRAPEVLMVHLESVCLVLVHSAAIVFIGAFLSGVTAQRLHVHEVGLLDVVELLLVDVHVAQEVIHLTLHRVNLCPNHVLGVQLARGAF